MIERLHDIESEEKISEVDRLIHASADVGEPSSDGRRRVGGGGPHLRRPTGWLFRACEGTKVVFRRSMTPHPLPELMDSVLNDGKDNARAYGWEVQRTRGGVLTIGTYDEPPESGGHVTNKAVFEP